jgi:hypothetical protein
VTHIPTRQLPARELIARNIAVPFWHEDDDKPVSYHLTVMVLPLRIIDELAILARKDAAAKMPNPTDNRHGSLDYPPSDRERHALIRHMLLNRTERNLGQGRGYQNSYDQLLFKIEKVGIDVIARQRTFKQHAFALIAQYYPMLRAEGEYALWRWEQSLTNTSRRTQ